MDWIDWTDPHIEDFVDVLVLDDSLFDETKDMIEVESDNKFTLVIDYDMCGEYWRIIPMSEKDTWEEESDNTTYRR